MVAGGAALIVQGLIHRQTKDVDLFLLDAAASTITSAATSFETAIAERGWSHQRVIDQNDFVRLLITGSGERLIVDLGRDSPAEEPVDATDLGPTLSLRDLARNGPRPFLIFSDHAAIVNPNCSQTVAKGGTHCSIGGKYGRGSRDALQPVAMVAEALVCCFTMVRVPTAALGRACQPS